MSSSSTSDREVRSGLDALVAEDFRPWRGLRLGLVCNPTSVDRRLRHLVDLVAAAPGVTLARLFGPEHGIRGTAQDLVGVDGVDRDAGTLVPVVSLYGGDAGTLTPSAESLEGLDALVFDLQDIGSRYYTFISTMALAMEAAARARVAFWVLDRPNPIGGVELEGGLVEPGFESFVGLHPLPVRHGMTVGELARLFNVERKIGCDLRVVELRGWRRSKLFDETGLPWIPPSPNMPTLDTALCYPGQCLLEGTNLSEGRGTTRPFEVFGAPFVDPDALAARLRAFALPGVAFRPIWFQPMFHKHAGEACGGVMLHVDDRLAFRPYATGLAVVASVRELWPEAFRWRTERYEFVDGIPAFDLLCGTDRIRRGLEAGQLPPEIRAVAGPAEAAFLDRRAPYLCYE